MKVSFRQISENITNLNSLAIDSINNIQMLQNLKGQMDRYFVQIILKVDGLLNERKKLENQRAQIVREECKLTEKKLENMHRIKRFSAYLGFETGKSVAIKHIEKGSVKYQRCQKAFKNLEILNIFISFLRLADNSKDTFFKDDPLLSPHFDKIELLEAFKIENNVLLRDFELQLRRTKESFLKGLFVPISKKEILNLALFGFKTDTTSQETRGTHYREKFLRIPQVFLKNNQSVIEKLLLDQQDTHLQTPLIKAYTSPTAAPLKSKLHKHLQKPSQSPLLLCFVLCRVIVSDQNSERSKTYHNPQSHSFDIRDPQMIYPEYIMLTKLTNASNSTEQLETRLNALQCELQQMYGEVQEIKQGRGYLEQQRGEWSRGRQGREIQGREEGVMGELKRVVREKREGQARAREDTEEMAMIQIARMGSNKGK